MRQHASSLRERGSLFAALFGAVAMTGVLALGVNAVMKGPLASMSDVTRRTVAENNMVAATRLAIIMASSAQPSGGDCDDDGYIEPIPFRNAGTNPKPAGGGYLPSTIGASMTDPWQTEYGYCVWDHGNKTVTDNVAACGGASAKRLKGAPTQTQIAIAVISAGKDKTFQTTCNAFVDTNGDGTPDTVLLNKPAGSDDIVLGYTYAQANSIGGGLWTLKTGSPTTAEIGSRDIEIRGSGGTTAARIGYDADLDLSGVGDFGAVKTDQIFSKNSGDPINLNGVVRAQGVTGLPAPSGAAETEPPVGGGEPVAIQDSFETWASGVPSGWTVGGWAVGGYNITQENTSRYVNPGGTPVSHGSYSIGMEATAGSTASTIEVNITKSFDLTGLNTLKLDRPGIVPSEVGWNISIYVGATRVYGPSLPSVGTFTADIHAITGVQPVKISVTAGPTTYKGFFAIFDNLRLEP